MKLPKIHFPKIKKKLFWLVVAGLMVAGAGGVWARPAPGLDAALKDSQTNTDKWIIGTQEVLGASLSQVSQRGVIDSIVGGLTLKITGYWDPNTNKVSGGVMGPVMRLTSFMYTTPPASTGRYLAYLKERINPVKPVYAQGTGWAAMEPVLPLWRLMRNTCYAIFVVIFVVIGFMIMLRKKVDAQAVASIQNAIPKIVTALILVTFSYAISGLVIDLGELITGLIGAILTSIDGFLDKEQFNTFLGMLKPPAGSGVYCLNDDGKACTKGAPFVYGKLANFFTISKSLMEMTGSLLTAIENMLSQIPYVGNILTLPLLGPGMMNLIISVMILQVILRSFFALLTAYVTIVMLTIISPFSFLLGALPGSEATGSWFKQLLSSVLIFPVMFFLLMLAAILSKPPGDFKAPLGNNLVKKQISEFRWSPVPFGSYWGREMIYNDAKKEWVSTRPDTPNDVVLQGFFINYLLALGIIMSLPKATELVNGIVEGKGVGGAIAGDLGEGLRGAMKNIPVVGGLLG